MLLINLKVDCFSTFKWSYLIKFFEQTALNTRPKIENHIVLVRDESTHEEWQSQPLETENQVKIATTLLTGYNGIFGVTDKN